MCWINLGVWFLGAEILVVKRFAEYFHAPPDAASLFYLHVRERKVEFRERLSAAAFSETRAWADLGKALSLKSNGAHVRIQCTSISHAHVLSNPFIQRAHDTRLSKKGRAKIKGGAREIKDGVGRLADRYLGAPRAPYIHGTLKCHLFLPQCNCHYLIWLFARERRRTWENSSGDALWMRAPLATATARRLLKRRRKNWNNNRQLYLSHHIKRWVCWTKSGVCARSTQLLLQKLCKLKSRRSSRQNVSCDLQWPFLKRVKYALLWKYFYLQRNFCNW